MSGKRQTMVLIGIALLIIAGILFYVGFTQPKVYTNEEIQIEESDTAAVNNHEEAFIDDAKAETVSDNKTVKSDSGDTEVTYKYPINLNKATVEELESIDGLGEVRASAIIEYREYIGGYKSVDQIMNIKGFDQSLYEKIAGYLTV